MDDIMRSKKESVEHCLRRIRQYYAKPSETPFEEDYLKQDAIELNFMRAITHCVALANHIVKSRKLGSPERSKDSFALLSQAEIIPDVMAKWLGDMMELGSLFVHEYQKVDIGILKDIVENHLDDLLDFTNAVMDVG